MSHIYNIATDTGLSDLVMLFPELSGLGVGVTQPGAWCPVVDGVVVVEHSPEHACRLGSVADRVQLMDVPDEVEVVARHQEYVVRQLLEIEKLLVPGDGTLQKLVVTIVR